MFRDSVRGVTQVTAMLAALLVVGACSDTMPTSSVDEVPLIGALDFVTGNGANPDQPSLGKVAATPNIEFFEVCKRWEGAAAVAEFEVSSGGATHTVRTDTDFYGPFSAMGYTDWMCRDVWVAGGAGAVVTVTETAVLGGANPYTTTVSLLEIGAPGATISGPSVTGLVDGATGSGVTAFFTNTEVPPPPTGDMGCTPGYWRQPHHYDSWMDFAPTDDFDATFGVAAIPLRRPERGTTAGLTLGEAVRLRGGGVNALIRHAVAALLNADQGFYPLTEAQVLADFQAAVGGGDVEGTKNTFAGYNELGCPLN